MAHKTSYLGGSTIIKTGNYGSGRQPEKKGAIDIWVEDALDKEISPQGPVRLRGVRRFKGMTERQKLLEKKAKRREKAARKKARKTDKENQVVTAEKTGTRSSFKKKRKAAMEKFVSDMKRRKASVRFVIRSRDDER